MLLVVRCFAVAFTLQSLFVTNDVAVANVSSARVVVTVVAGFIATQFGQMPRIKSQLAVE